MSNREELLIKLINKKGESNQLFQAVEELSELIQSISKFNRCGIDVKHISKRQNLIEEIADVEIMIQQLMIIADVDVKEVELWKNMKFKRIEEELI